MARQVLPIVGAVVGAYFGNPQLGYAIGSIIGNAVDPLQIDGPRVGDAARQTTNEGAPRPIPYGRVLYAANVLEVGPLDKVYRNESQGKGGGPEVKNEYLYQTFVYGFGEAPDGGLTGYSLVKIDGAVVYDSRVGSTIAEQSAKFANKVRFYLGTNTQEEDPTLEAIHGFEETCVYRGTPYLVLYDWDITGRAGTLPVVEMEVVTAGSQNEDGGGWMTGPVSVNGALGGSQQYFQLAPTLEELPLSTPRLAPITFEKISKTTNGALFMYSNSNMRVSFNGGSTWEVCSGPGTTFGTIATSKEVTWNGNYYYHSVYRSADGKTWAAVAGLPSGANELIGREFFNNPVVCLTNVGGSGAGIWLSYDDGANWELKRSPGAAVSTMVGGHLFWRWIENSTNGRYTDDDFDTVFGEPGSFIEYRAYYSDDFHGSWMRKTFSNGAIWWDGNPPLEWELTTSLPLGAHQDNTLAWGDYQWAALANTGYLYVNREGGAPGAWTLIPDRLYGNLGNIVHVGNASRGETSSDGVRLSDIVADVCRRCTMDDSEFDVSDLVDIWVEGLLFAGGYTGKDAIRSLSPAYYFDGAVMDGVLTFVRRGKPVKGTITSDDLLQAPVKAKRSYPREYPKKLHMGYMSSVTNYAPTKATSVRDSSDVRVTGEKQFQVPVVLTSDEAARICDVNHKFLFTEAEGDKVLVLGEDFVKATSTDCYTVELDGNSDRMRIIETQYADGEVQLHLVYDRVSNVDSTAVGPILTPPTTPPAIDPGLTRFFLLNIPGLNEYDDLLGYRAAVAPTSGSWNGAQVQRKNTIATDYSVAADITVPAVCGQLVAHVASASRFLTDNDNSLRVSMYYGAPEGRTDFEWLRQGGAVAVCNHDAAGTAELIQYRDVVDNGDGTYTLSPLLRGRRNSPVSAHIPGSAVIFLENSFFLPVGSTYLGADVLHRAVSFRSSPEDALEHENTFSTLYAQVEFEVSGLKAERSAANVITATWLARGRYGTAFAPIHSREFQGFKITVVKGTTVIELPIQLSNTVSYDATALGAGVTIRVQQINRFTGNGPASEVTV